MHAAIRIGINEKGPQELTVVDHKGKAQKLNAEKGSAILDVPSGYALKVVKIGKETPAE